MKLYYNYDKYIRYKVIYFNMLKSWKEAFNIPLRGYLYWIVYEEISPKKNIFSTAGALRKVSKGNEDEESRVLITQILVTFDIQRSGKGVYHHVIVEFTEFKRVYSEKQTHPWKPRNRWWWFFRHVSRPLDRLIICNWGVTSENEKKVEKDQKMNRKALRI